MRELNSNRKPDQDEDCPGLYLGVLNVISTAVLFTCFERPY
ncbi:hypothetical protein SAMN05216404_10438 [Nitrosospira multiformis]|uniref:Uncharacterized protein n=1 Tax=Nitrosospira multiformis TaxID=1231 RepID=A0A1H8FYL3_9PROT|nr:hypothetical protein SAMN05216404_10438 [Nitrosospira multiformis]